MTKAAVAIVTALGEGPSSALVLSQRLNVTHANARQVLRRLTVAGVVTKLRRGLYGLCDNGHCDKLTDAYAPVREAARERQREAGKEHGRGQEKVVEQIPQAIQPAPKTRDVRAKAAGENRVARKPGFRTHAKYIDLADTARPAWAGPPAPRIPTEAQLAIAIAGAWSHFEAMNDPHNPVAWA